MSQYTRKYSVSLPINITIFLKERENTSTNIIVLTNFNLKSFGTVRSFLTYDNKNSIIAQIAFHIYPSNLI